MLTNPQPYWLFLTYLLIAACSCHTVWNTSSVLEEINTQINDLTLKSAEMAAQINNLTAENTDMKIEMNEMRVRLHSVEEVRSIWTVHKSREDAETEVETSSGTTARQADFVGPPGPPGPPGMRCPKGNVGRDGRDGIDGLNGRHGADGVNGINGLNGRDGLPGSPGAAGRDGKNGQVSPQGMPGGGAVYTRWGRTTCGDNSTLIYAGFTGMSKYSQAGGGVNYQCMVFNTEHNSVSSVGEYSNHISGTEYQSHHYSVFENAANDQNASCAICYAKCRPSTLMIPGKRTCPPNWHEEYEGYLMSE